MENLEWVNNSENHLHAYRVLNRVSPMQGKTGLLNPKSIDINQYSIDGKFIKLHHGVMNAERDTGSDKSDIVRVCKGKQTTCNGFMWRYTSDVPPFKDIEGLNVLKYVGQYDLNGNLIAKYKTRMEAKEKTGIDNSSIGRVISGISSSAGGYFWKDVY